MLMLVVQVLTEIEKIYLLLLGEKRERIMKGTESSTGPEGIRSLSGRAGTGQDQRQSPTGAGVSTPGVSLSIFVGTPSCTFLSLKFCFPVKIISYNFC